MVVGVIRRCEDEERRGIGCSKWGALFGLCFNVLCVLLFFGLSSAVVVFVYFIDPFD